MNLKPLGDRIVVKVVEELERTKGGIVLPDTAKEKPQEAEVMAVGPGGRNEKGDRVPMEVKAGDHVIFAKYSGTEFKQDDEEYLILRESDVLAIVVVAARRPRPGPKGEPRCQRLLLYDEDARTRARARRQPSRRRREDHARPQRPQRRAREEVRLAARSRTTASRSRRRSSWPIRSRTRARSSCARWRPRRTTSPATARRPPRCSRRRSSARASRTSRPAPIRSRSSAASTGRSRAVIAELRAQAKPVETQGRDRPGRQHLRARRRRSASSSRTRWTRSARTA